jgi:hypothetical protein
MTAAFDFVYRYRLWVLGAIAVLCFIDVAAIAISYLLYPGYMDHGESLIAMTSWRLFQGVFLRYFPILFLLLISAMAIYPSLFSKSFCR